MSVDLAQLVNRRLPAPKSADLASVQKAIAGDFALGSATAIDVRSSAPSSQGKRGEMFQLCFTVVSSNTLSWTERSVSGDPGSHMVVRLSLSTWVAAATDVGVHVGVAGLLARSTP